MNTPDFFNQVPTITMYDPLSKLLGAVDDGMITYSYVDAVKLAGHSCPTVAGAYLMALHGIKALYKDEIPVRGDIIVTCKEKREDGVSGVISNILTLITGASEKEGFKGLKGLYHRNGLLEFGVDQVSLFELERKGTHTRVGLTYDPSVVATQPIPPNILQAVTNDSATDEEKALFAKIWQKNVQTILEAFYNPDLLHIKYIQTEKKEHL